MASRNLLRRAICPVCGHDGFVTVPKAEAIACASCGFVCTRQQALIAGECADTDSQGSWTEHLLTRYAPGVIEGLRRRR